MSGIGVLFAVAVPLLTAGQPTKDRYGDPLPEGAFCRLGTLRYRGDPYLEAVALSPDGRLLALAGKRSIKVVDADTGKERYRLAIQSRESKRANLQENDDQERHLFDFRSGVSKLVFIPRQRGLIIGWHNKVVIWDFRAGKERKLFSSKEQMVSRLIMSADGSIAAGTLFPDVDLPRRNGRPAPAVIIWDVVAARAVVTLTPIRKEGGAATLSADGKTLATWGGRLEDEMKKVITRILQLWRTKDRKELRRLAVETDEIRDAGLSPDGKQLAVLTAPEVILFDVASGKRLGGFPTRDSESGYRSLAYAADGRSLFVLTDIVLQRRLLPGGKCVAIHRCPGLESAHRLRMHGERLRYVHGDLRHAEVYEPAAGRHLGPKVVHDWTIEMIGFREDGRTLLSIGNNRSFLWDLRTGRAKAQPGLDLGDSVMSFSPDGKFLGVHNRYGVQVIDMTTGEQVWHVQRGLYTIDYNGHTIRGQVAFSPDGKFLAASHHPKGSQLYVRLWNTESGVPGRDYGPVPGVIWGIAMSPDGRSLAALAVRGRGRERWPAAVATDVRCWDVQAGKERWRSRGTARKDSTTLAFSADGGWLASPTSLWNAVNGRLVHSWPEEVSRPGPNFVFSPDSRLLLVGAGSQEKAAVVAVDLLTGKPLTRRRGHTAGVRAVVLSPDRKTVASASEDGTTLLWELDAFRGRIPASRSLAAADLQALWDQLAEGDPAAAHAAVLCLAGSPMNALPFLRGRLKPAAQPKAAHVRRLISGLDAKTYAARKKAEMKLAELGPQAVPYLRRALKKNPSPEIARRCRSLLAKVNHPGRVPSRRRLYRSVEVLERIRSEEARRQLQSLASGDPAADLTKQAKAAVNR
jgi:WD40 repeat protein